MCAMNKTPSIERSYINRELSWLGFNDRVLDQAYNEDIELLDRVKFLAITASNLDEFFMVRVGSLKLAVQKGRAISDPAGLSGPQQLAEIRKRVIEFNDRQDRCLLEHLDPELAKQGIVRLSNDSLNVERHEHLHRFFRNEIQSVIAPTATDQPENFPVLKGARLCVCVRLTASDSNQLWTTAQKEIKRNQERKGSSKKDLKTGEALFATERYVLIPMPISLERVVLLPSETGVEYIFLEDIVGLFIQELFPGEAVMEWTTLRVTRNADMDLDDDADDFVSEMKQLIDSREKSQCVRLRVAQTTSPKMLDFLMKALQVNEEDTYIAKGPLDLSSLFAIAGISGLGELKSQEWPAFPILELQEPSEIFDQIVKQDVIAFHPYQSFEPVVQFIEQAAMDPQVIAIKQTLYRTSRNSRIVKALAQAAENGKHVTAVVELKARFDEERNLDWAKFLEDAGVDVIYGITGFKVHAKIAIVVRRESTGIRRYVHIGTGNYNESTARLYCDVSLFTCDEQIGIDAVHAFNAITGLSTPQDLEKLRLAPLNLRETIHGLIQNEKQNATAGIKAAITIKVNSLVDQQLIDALYDASQAGVKVKLNVRGICCLRPGVPELSENIQVVSVVDRFLEHARILHFHHGGDDLLFITSADWMGRNLDRRIELLTPILDKNCRQKLFEVLKTYFKGNVNVWEIQANGSHKAVEAGKREPFRPQQRLYQMIGENFASHTDLKSSVFKAIRGKD